MKESMLVLYLVLSVTNTGTVLSISNHPIILVISYDGFRYNYFDKKVSPNLERLRNSGAHADYMRNVFITKTFTNHHSIATGVYPEVHGVLGNSVYDPKYRKILGYSEELWHYSEDVVPMWTLNQKAGEGRHSGVMMWPGGGDQDYQKVPLTFQQAYNTSIPFFDRVDTVISWLLHPTTPANLVFLYFEEPDKTAHVYGPESRQVADAITKVDNVTGYLLNRLDEYNLTNSVNLFFLSDHGFETVAVSRILNITEYIPSGLNYTIVERSPVCLFYTEEDNDRETIYSALKNASEELGHFSVFHKHDIHDQWHYKKNRRAPDILVLADESYAFDDMYQYLEEYVNQTNSTVSENSTFGVHGYDNSEMNMHPYFIATGPLIKKEYKLDPFDTVDLYSLFSYMLQLKPPHTNGTLANVRSLLQSEPDPSLPYILGGVVIAALSITAAAILTICLLRHRKKKSEASHSYRSIEQSNSESVQRDMEAQHLLDGTDGED